MGSLSVYMLTYSALLFHYAWLTCEFHSISISMETSFLSVSSGNSLECMENVFPVCCECSYLNSCSSSVRDDVMGNVVITTHNRRQRMCKNRWVLIKTFYGALYLKFMATVQVK